MIQHVVAWKLREQSESERAELVTEFRSRLDALVGVVPGLRSVALTEDVHDTDANFDVVLISMHDTREALAVYQDHPDHVAIGRWYKDFVVTRAAVDSEV